MDRTARTGQSARIAEVKGGFSGHVCIADSSGGMVSLCSMAATVFFNLAGFHQVVMPSGDFIEGNTTC